MNTFRFFWTAHKWVGISIATVLVVSATTGFLLLLKKEADWIQPPTRTGSAGSLEGFLPLAEVWQRVAAQSHPDFKTLEDLDRIDVRPERRVYKVRSVHNHSEMQVDAISGAILSTAVRRSDWLESLHDGSWFGEPIHDYLMPLVALCVLFLVFSGVWLWLQPLIKRRRRRRART